MNRNNPTATIRRTLDALLVPGDPHELRIVDTKQGTVSGYFTDRETMAQVAANWSGKAPSVYVVLNPAHRSVLARAENATFGYGKIDGTSDKDISARRWLLIDADPVRPSGISSTAGEHAAASASIERIHAYLQETHGWPALLTADSGNGAHLLARVDLPNDDAARDLCKNVLAALAARFDTDAVTVDTKTFNASRVCTLYGTLKAKGSHFVSGETDTHRPHRISRLLDVGSGEIVSLEQLASVATLVPAPASRPSPTVGSGGKTFDGPYDMEGFIRRHGLTTRAPVPYEGGLKWQMDCLFNPSHKAPDAFLQVTASGAAAFSCSHNSCQNNDWHALRDLLNDRPEPNRSAKRETPQQAQHPAPKTKPAQKTASGNDSAAATIVASPFRLDGTGNAERFIARHGKNLRYDHQRKVWYCWNGKRWEEDARAKVQELGKETAVGLYTEANEAAKNDDAAGAAALSAWAKQTNKARAIADMLTLAASSPVVAALPSDFDADPWRFNCQNGTLDLKTGELSPHDPADLITRISPASYKPDATAPLWQTCLERWQPDANVRDFLQRFAGYTLTGDAGEETALFLYGLGRNGKSKLVFGLKHVMGDYAADLRIEVLMESKHQNAGTTPDLDPLPGCRMLVVGELKRAGRLNEAFLKTVTGGESVTVNPKYGKVFTFKPKFKPYLFGNHKPQIEPDEGIRSRLPLVPFNVTIPAGERDTQLENKLKTEADGILAWAMRGCLEWQKTRLSPPETILAATKAFHEEMDTFGQFLADCCIVGEKLWTPVAQLREAYEGYIMDRGDRVLTGNQFAERLRQAECEFKPGRSAGKVVRGWAGVALKNEDYELVPPDSSPSVDAVDAVDAERTKSPRKTILSDFTPTDANGVNGVNKSEDLQSGKRETSSSGGSKIAEDAADFAPFASLRRAGVEPMRDASTLTRLLRFVQNEYHGTGLDICTAYGFVVRVENARITGVWNGPLGGKLAFGADYFVRVDEPLPAPVVDASEEPDAISHHHEDPFGDDERGRL